MRRCPPLINQSKRAPNNDCTSGRICDRDGWLRLLEIYDDKDITTDKELN